MNENKIKFRRQIIKLGGSLAITLPQEIVEYQGVKEGEEITIMPDINKKGQKYTAIFKEV